MANFCKKCGNKIDTHDIYCPYCGIKIDNYLKDNVGNKYDNNAILGLVLSILGFTCCTFLSIPGLIVSIVNLQNVNNGKINDKNKTIVIAGIVIGVLGLLYFLGHLIIRNGAIINNVGSWRTNA